MLLGLALAGCGGDGSARDTAPKTDTEGALADTETTETRTTKTENDPRTEAEPAPQGDGQGGANETPTSPEEQEGGAGDEEPARSEAHLSGSGGRITPRLVSVPPFISVRVVLRSADGRSYSLRIADRTLRAGGSLSSASAQLDGLRPGRAYVGTDATGAKIRIVASAEPGP